jgi:hypothetical protein
VFPDGVLHALTTFDREERKRYLIPVRISDSGLPTQTGTSTLTVEIGDDNDNPMKDGTSNIHVYNYKVWAGNRSTDLTRGNNLLLLSLDIQEHTSATAFDVVYKVPI